MSQRAFKKVKRPHRGRCFAFLNACIAFKIFYFDTQGYLSDTHYISWEINLRKNKLWFLCLVKP
jgi:hypothetical protein